MKKVARQQALKNLLERCQMSAARTVAGLFKKEDEPGYNRDAEASWKDMRGVTRAALILTQGVMAAERAKVQSDAPRVFGVVVVPQRIDDRKHWEQLAADAGKPRAIEAAVVEVKK